MADIRQDPKIIDDFSAGVVRKVSIHKMPANAVPYAVNFVFDDYIGEAILRKGTSMVGAQIVDNKSVLGLANLRRRSDTAHNLLAVVNDATDTNADIYATPSSWAKSLQDDTKDLKTRFCQFLDSIFRLNGTDAPKSFDGTTWATSGGVLDIGNMPQGKYAIAYKDRVHVIGEDGVLYSSSVPRFYLAYDAQSANFNVNAIATGGTSGAKATIYKDTDAGTSGVLQLIGKIGTFANNETITDDSGGSATVDGTGYWGIDWRYGYVTTPIDPDNGVKGKCTGLAVIGGLMFIFFERAFYTWNGSSVATEPISSIGCSSFESIAYGEDQMFFANKDGIYMSQGGFPKKISRYVQDLFDNMDSANYQNIAGGCDGKHYFCSIGNVTIDGLTITNCVLRYSIQSQEWSILSYPTRPTVFSQYISTNDVKLVYGDTDGNVIEIDSSATSDTNASTVSPIDFELHTHDMFEPMQSIKKTVSEKIIVHSEDSSAAKVYYRADKHTDQHGDWQHIGELKVEQQTLDIPIIQHKIIRFKIAGRSTTGRLRVKAIDIPTFYLNSY